MKTVVNWQENMAFEADSDSGHKVLMDAGVDNNGGDKAPRPKEFILIGLAGCTGMDVVAILRKMRITPEKFRIEVNGDQTEEHPKIFKKIHIKYIFSKGIDEEKAKRAVDMSQEKYCGVSEILRKSADVSYEIIYE